MRKMALCICEHKGTDQQQCNSAADQSLCYCNVVQSLYFLNQEFKPLEISVPVQPGLCQTWLKSPKIYILTCSSNCYTHIIGIQAFQMANPSPTLALGRTWRKWWKPIRREPQIYRVLVQHKQMRASITWLHVKPQKTSNMFYF